MEVRFTIEEVIAKLFEAEIPLVSGTVVNKESVIDQAQEAYDKFLLEGGELSGDQIEQNWFVLCDECGREIEDDKIFVVDNKPVCGCCHENIVKYQRRTTSLKEAGVNLDDVASLIRADMITFNHAYGMGLSVRNTEAAKRISAFEAMLTAMHIPYSHNFDTATGKYVCFTLNGKSYNV